MKKIPFPFSTRFSGFTIGSYRVGFESKCETNLCMICKLFSSNGSLFGPTQASVTPICDSVHTQETAQFGSKTNRSTCDNKADINKRHDAQPQANGQVFVRLLPYKSVTFCIQSLKKPLTKDIHKQEFQVFFFLKQISSKLINSQ